MSRSEVRLKHGRERQREGEKQEREITTGPERKTA